MVSKVILVIAQAIFFKSIAAQVIGCGAGPFGYANSGFGYSSSEFSYAAPAAALAASNGPGLMVSSSSPLGPIGISVSSENIIEGVLAVAGALPFLGTVGLEGELPTAGAGNVAYNCGDGAVAITAEDIAESPLEYAAVGPIGYGPAAIGEVVAPFGYAATSPIGFGPAAFTEVLSSPLGYASPCNYATSPLNYATTPINYAASPLNYASPISYDTELIGLGASPLRYSAGTLGYGADLTSYSAGLLGSGTGPYGAGPFSTFGGYGFI